MDPVAHETTLRLAFSLGGLFCFWIAALIFPFRKKEAFKDKSRILSNLAFSFGNGIVLKLIAPAGLVAISQSPPMKLQSLISLDSLGLWGIVLSLLLLDCAIYWQHRITHIFAPLWRLHRVHHSDIEIDTSSAGRFHIIEIGLSFLYKAVLVLLFNIPAAAIVIFEITLNFGALFNHSNFKLPPTLEKFLRWLVITPDLHRIHHSVRHDEMNCNFGFSISLWDRLFGSYKEVSHSPQESMEIGLNQFRKKEEQSFLSLLKQPFLKN